MLTDTATTEVIERPATSPEILPEPREASTPAETNPPAAAETAAEAEAQDAPKADAPSFRDAWLKMSPQERAEHLRETWDEDIKGSPWLQGKTGAAKQRAEREAQAERDRIAAEVRAEIDAEARAQRKAEAVKNEDAYALLEIERQEAEAREAAKTRTVAEQQDAVRLDTYAGNKLGQVAVAAFTKLPEAVQAALKAPDGTFNRNWAEAGETADVGLARAIETAITAGIEAGLKDANRVKALREEIEAAVRAEAGLQKVASKADPDTRGAAAEAATDDTQFIKDYAAGRSRDHARWKRIEAGF